MGFFMDPVSGSEWWFDCLASIINLICHCHRVGDRSTLYRGEDIESSIAKKMTPWASTMASLWVSKGDLLVFLMQMTFLRSPRFKTVVKFPLTFLGVFFRNLSQVLWLSRSVSANPEVTAISTLLGSLLGGPWL